MTPSTTLHALLDHSARTSPNGIAVVDPGRADIDYAELARLSDALRDRLRQVGVAPGDRVGIYMRKSIDAIVAIFGILKCGAAYVPVDPDAPVARCAFILDNCSVRVVVTEQRLETALRTELERLGRVPPLLAVDERSGPIPLAELLARMQRDTPVASSPSTYPDPEGLAYILYTSGSTGKPKGVMLAHRSATTFVDWCSETLGPRANDRFSSHAPLHFDLSILDVFVSLKHGATLVLIGEEVGKEPLALAALIAESGITIWYSTPSILGMLAQYGKLERHDVSALRIVLFAGEVFPVPQLRALKSQWSHPRYLNLYGPTETNVCTFHEIPAVIPAERTDPYPIGRTCSHLCSLVVDQTDRPVEAGTEGELVIAGPGVMQGYWNLPERNAQAFLVDAGGERWYRTGDLVVDAGDGEFVFHGRRDRMVKRRGYRVELGEIEAGLAAHPAAREVAVIALPKPDASVRIKAYMSLRNGTRPSLVELKQYCMERLPRYMVPDAFGFLDALPRTSTDKIDYQSLTSLS